MQYLLLIYQTEADLMNQTEAERKGLYGEYMKLTKDITDAGQHRGGNALQRIANATSVRVRDGKAVVTDGPFAETREQLGGYYLVDVEHLDDAIAIAGRIPSARWGTIEIRPVQVMPAAATA